MHVVACRKVSLVVNALQLAGQETGETERNSTQAGCKVARASLVGSRVHKALRAALLSYGCNRRAAIEADDEGVSIRESREMNPRMSAPYGAIAAMAGSGSNTPFLQAKG